MRATGAVLNAEVEHIEAQFGKSRRRRSAGKTGTNHNHVKIALVGGIDKFLMSLVVGPLVSNGAFGHL